MNEIRDVRALIGWLSGGIGDRRARRVHGCGAFALALVLVAGCASQGGTAARTPVAITDVASLAGKWVGLLDAAAGRDKEDYVEVTIEGGTYRASSARTIGVMDLRGTVAVDNGRLVIKGERGGQGTGILYTEATPDQRLLVVNGTASDGRTYTARLRPQR